MTTNADYTPRLEDLLASRLTLYGRLLAGSALSFPVEAMAAYARIDPALITDDRARAYLAALHLRKTELEQAGQPDATDASIALATESGDLFDITGWAIDAAQVGKNAGEIVKELARMGIALSVLDGVRAEFSIAGANLKRGAILQAAGGVA